MAEHILCLGSASQDLDIYNPPAIDSVSVLRDGWGSPAQTYTCDFGKANYGDVPSEYISAEDFNEMWPLILLMFVSAYVIKRIIGMFSQNAGRN